MNHLFARANRYYVTYYAIPMTGRTGAAVRPFDLDAVLAQPFRIDQFLDVLFVIDSFEQFFEAVRTIADRRETPLTS